MENELRQNFENDNRLEVINLLHLKFSATQMTYDLKLSPNLQYEWRISNEQLE